jgi:DNA helicase II / ATP-dependent DNA helicase PcrA
MNLELSDVANAALEADRPILVLGGPGSGKTTLSLLKAKTAIAGLGAGQEVLFLSFSRAAIRQLLIRCKDLLSPDERRIIAVKTYHAFCMEVLLGHGHLLTGRPLRLFFPGPERVAKAAFDGDWSVERARLAREDGLCAFDEFASVIAELLSKFVCVRELIADRYPVIILDEFQDTDDSQWEMVKLLSKGSLLITLADPDQRIFEYDDRVDPRRLDQLREFLAPAQFDLGTDNHRSPEGGILSFADGVLRNRRPPATEDVKLVTAWPNGFDALVHAGVIWTLSQLRKSGIQDPSLAVLCRANPFVSDLSAILSVAHEFNGSTYSPVDHHVVWDAELSAAAAQVVARILEWPNRERGAAVGDTLEAIAHFYELKNSIKHTANAQQAVRSFRVARDKVLVGETPRIDSAKALVTAYHAGLELSGDPVADWRRARHVVADIPKLKEIFISVRFVRLFRASDEIGGRLAQQWADTGTYGQAADIVRRTLDMGRLVSSHSDPSGVLIMTMHKSKGKEFDGVVLVEGRYTSRFFDETREDEPFEASRRLLRVGITRARRQVLIVRPQGARPLFDA